MWTIISGIFGGLIRLAPEFIKMWNRKQEMAHEKDMQKIAYDFQVLRGKQEVDVMVEKGAAEWNSGAIVALQKGIEAAAKPSGVRWIDGLNALMRPLITLQWVVLLYPGTIITTFVFLIVNNVGVLPAMTQVFGESEKAVCFFIIDFWFVGRVLDAGRKKYGGA